MNKRILTSCLFLSIFWIGCCTGESPADRYNFPDVLNIRNSPDSTDDWNTFFFSDMGAWFGFALPDSPQYYGSFMGPFSMRTQKWMARDLVRLSLTDSLDKSINFHECREILINYFPGILKQQYGFEKFQVDLSLFYISRSEVLITAEISNKTKGPLVFSIQWAGTLINENCRLINLRDQVIINDETDNYFAQIVPQEESLITIDGQSYFCDEKKKTIVPALNSLRKQLVFRYSDEKNLSSQLIRNPDTLYRKNLERWNYYLAQIFSPKSKWLKQKKYRNLAVKALETLVLNWRSAAGDLQHDGLFPSSSVSYFNGFWAWDSWKHAVALSKFAPELAKDQVRAMFDYQNDKGMVADCIYMDKTENNWRNSKPPLAAWAAWKIFEQTGDQLFIREIFPKILKYHQWWAHCRDHDHNGLYEYGSTDGTVIAAKWESGMDNAVRFDHSKILKNNDNEWSLNQESVDLNAYLFAEKLFLVKLARAIDKHKLASDLAAEADRLKQNIRTAMFDETSGYFYDILLENQNFLATKGPEGWIPLLTGLATQTQASKVAAVMGDPTEFATYLPFPTVTGKSPEFSTGYWRGTVWLDQACFGIMALRRYGYQNDADRFTRFLLNRAEGLIEDDYPICENYGPLDGKAIRARNFSWSAAHILMLLWDEDFD
ncbi:MAG: glycoside hydrolase [Candidatus Marinimicrobia bacterium]|nr:glycoside hydrolase [Candidatus Neomarinimicrobiota bacterium]